MERSKGSKKVKQAILAFAFLFLACGGPTLPVHAQAVTLFYASYGTLGNYNVVEANLTCNFAYTLGMVVFAIWKNNLGQTVAVTAGGITLSPGATGTAFAPLIGALPIGSYFVIVYAITTNNNPVSISLEFPVTIE